MGLFSKIFGSENDETDRSAEGADLVSETRASDGSKNPSAKPANPGSAASKVPEKNEVESSSSENNAKRRSGGNAGRAAPPSARAETVRGGSGARAPAPPVPGAADATPSPTSRPSVPAKIEARLHASPTYNVTGGGAQKKGPPAAAKPRTEEVREPPVPKGTQPRGDAARASPVVSVGAAPPSLSKTLQLDTRPAGAPALKRDPSAGSRAPADPLSPVWSKRVEASELVLEPFTAPAPPAVPAVPQGSTHADTDDVDAAFERIAESTAAPGSNRGRLADNGVAKEENRRLFRQMIVGHARPIREFVIELSVGPTTAQWLEIVRPAARSILDAATVLDEVELVAALTDFTRALDAASLTFKPKIDGADRESLLVEYQKLARVLPAAFDVRADRDRREPIVVHHLLLLAPGVHKVAIDKLYAAGLGSLDALCRSSVDDLIALGRLEPDAARAITRRFQDYWRARTEHAPDKGDDRARSRIKTLIDELGRAHEAFERAESDDDKEKKRRARLDRRTKMLELNVLLAELGEVDLVQELERTATVHRIERVKEFVERRSDHAA